MTDFNQEFYQKNRFDSAQWAAAEELQAEGFFKPSPLAVQIGFVNQAPLYVVGDAPITTIGGAGSGKGAGVLMYNAINYQGSMVINDPKGEIAAVSLFHQHRLNIRAYCFNPFGLHDLPQHSVNPLDILKADSPTFHSDSQLIAQNFIPVSGSAEGKHFEEGAQRWIDAFMKFDVLTNGKTSLPRLYHLVMQIEGDTDGFLETADRMQACGHIDIAQVAGEIVNKKLEAPKEFTGFMSTIYNAFKFMKEPALRSMLDENADFSLNVLAGVDPSKIYIMIPAEFLGLFSPVVRLIFAVSMFYKQRAPDAPPVLHVFDEAAQLGRFPELLKFYTYARGGGNRAWSFWQDTGQMVGIYGREALTTFLSSSQVRQFVGVRDLETANLISLMLGSQTLAYDNRLQQRGDEQNKRRAVQNIMAGADPFQAVHDAYHHEENTQHQEKQARPLLTVSEALNLPDDRQVIFVSGKNTKPILAYKYYYYTRREMAGKYLANPYHPPVNKVVLQGKYWARKVKVKTAKVPRRYRDYPQFKNGTYKYVSGFK
jgi:type IV secretion system protein VirD4